MDDSLEDHVDRQLTTLQLRGEPAEEATGSCDSGSGSGSEYESSSGEEESFGNMRRRMFAKTVNVSASEKVRMTEEKKEALARALRALKTSVSTVELSKVKLESTDIKELCAALSANKTLKELKIHSASLDGAASGRIAGALWDSTSLERLYLPGNQIASSGCGMVFDACCNMQNLQELDLSSNGIGGDRRRSLFTSLPSCKALKVLSLNGNALNCHDTQLLAEALGSLGCKIKRLSLASNYIADAGAAHLARVLPRSLSVVELDLTSNKISDAGAGAIAEALAQLPQLECLKMSENPMTETAEGLLRAAAPPTLRLDAAPASLQVAETTPNRARGNK